MFLLFVLVHVMKFGILSQPKSTTRITKYYIHPSLVRVRVRVWCFHMALVGSVPSACGAVIGTVNAGQYYPAGGASQDCILSGTTYDFHSFDFNGQVHVRVHTMSTMFKQ